jgi:copper resistance protein B
MTSQVHAGGERDPLLTYFLMDTLEISDQTGNPTSWGVTSWLGKDWHKLYLKSEGETLHGQTESEHQLLYNHPIEKYGIFKWG